MAEAGNNSDNNDLRWQKLNQVYRLVMKSGKLWKERTLYYNDAFPPILSIAQEQVELSEKF